MSSLPAPESRPANLPSSRSLAAARRAGKACQNCRLRKVKCDALLHGIPCRNCRNDDAQCIMGGCRRGRKRRTWYSNVKDDVAASRSDVADNAAVVEPNAQSTPPRTFPERHGTTEKPSTDNTTVLNSVMSLGDIPATLQLLGPYNAPFTPPPEQYNFPEQYLKFRPILQTLSQDDFEYVQSKKATELPPNPLRDEIVRCYIDHVHPYMPLLDAYELLRLIGPSVRRSTKTQYSILLFQCVMFAAIAFVDERLIQDAGYPNAQAARKAFYLKTRVLYDMDVETDNFTLVQCLLLMSLWSERLEDHKQGWHWIGIAISLAYSLCLNRDPSPLNLSPTEKSLRIRLWWCLFMRDRLLCLCLSRPMRISDESFNVPPPSPHDVEVEFVSQVPTSYVPIGVAFCKESTRRKLARIYTANAHLCVIVGEILSTCYSILKTTQAQYSAMLLPKSTDTTKEAEQPSLEETVATLDAKLKEWSKELESHPFDMSHDQRGARRLSTRSTTLQFPVSSTASTTEPKNVIILSALLHLSYYTALSALHRTRPNSQYSRQRLSECTPRSSRICAFLNARGLAQFLPVNAVPMVVPSIISLALIIRSSKIKNKGADTTLKTKGDLSTTKDNLSELIATLWALKRPYCGALTIASFVCAFFHKIGLRLVDNMSQPGTFPGHAKFRRFEVEIYNQDSPAERARLENDEFSVQHEQQPRSEPGVLPCTEHTKTATEVPMADLSATDLNGLDFSLFDDSPWSQLFNFAAFEDIERDTWGITDGIMSD